MSGIQTKLITLITVLFFGGAIIGLSQPVLALDRLGSQWNGCEYTGCQWKFQWRRTNANSNVFNAYWSHRTNPKVQGKITISISGTTVTVSRPALGGAPSCTYTGTYHKRDIHNARPAWVSGTYTCGSYTGPWKATIH